MFRALLNFFCRPAKPRTLSGEAAEVETPPHQPSSSSPLRDGAVVAECVRAAAASAAPASHPVVVPSSSSPAKLPLGQHSAKRSVSATPASAAAREPTLLFVAQTDAGGPSTSTPPIVGVARPLAACAEDAAVTRHHTPFEQRVERAMEAEAAFRDGLRAARLQEQQAGGGGESG